MRLIRRFIPLLMIAIVGLLLMPLNINAQQFDTRLYSGLRWRMLGPFRGGRVNAVSGVVGQPDTFYFGSVSLRSRRKRRAWGVSPRRSGLLKFEPAKWAKEALINVQATKKMPVNDHQLPVVGRDDFRKRAI